MRLAEIAGGIGPVIFLFRRIVGMNGWVHRFRCRQDFFGARPAGLGDYGPWPAAAAPATSAPAAAAGTTRRDG